MSILKPIGNSAFDGHRNALYKAAKVVVDTCLDKAAAHLTCSSSATGTSDDGSWKDVAVTVDGTSRMRRGYSSMCGIAFAIVWETGQVVDFCVLSRYCQFAIHASCGWQRGGPVKSRSKS
eukprot:scpid62412/ scgid32537/ 